MGLNQTVICKRSGVATKYHRIVSVLGDYDHGDSGILNVEIESYTTEDRRNQEKEQLVEIEKDIERYYELKRKKTHESGLTLEEFEELFELDIQELEARKIERKSFYSQLYTVSLPEDLRKKIYECVEKQIPVFRGK